MRKISIETTKRGIPALWESGGGMTSGGSATIITKRDGTKPRAVYVRRGGHLACGQHALVAVHEGFYIVHAGVSRGARSYGTIERIVSVTVKDIDGEKWEATAEVETVNKFSRGEWDTPLDEKFVPAVEAAFQKAGTYHCRGAYFIDYAEKSVESEADKSRLEVEMKRQDEERAALRKAKADREARAKEEVEGASKAAKEAGLGIRLDELNIRLTALGRELVEQGEVSFKWGWQNHLYNEQNVVSFEGHVAQLESQKTEHERQRLAREAFQPKFEVLKPRAEAISLSIEFTDDRVKLSGDYYGQAYSEEGLAAFCVSLDQKEREAAKARAKATAEAEYQRRKTEAVALGLPTDIRIWRRRGGRTNAGDGWVIGPDGGDRPNTGWTDLNSRRLHRYGECEMIWEQILPSEVVLKWSKSCSAAAHNFEIVHLPTESLTEAQLERIREIQDELEREWEGARGLASGIPSPPVGDGWGLLPKSLPNPSDGKYTLDDLRRKFNGR